jgi:hypothetical protein
MSRQVPPRRDPAGARQAARQLLASSEMGDDLLRRSATVGRALPVVAPGGELHSWFVPVAVGDRLAAFFQFLPDGVLMRFSAFPHQPGGFEGCPPSADWLDLARIQARAVVQQRPNESIGKPFLTYDRAPDRLVWAVPFRHARGGERLVYVAGQAVYAPRSGNAFR